MNVSFKDNIIRILLIVGALSYLIGIIMIGTTSLSSPNTKAVLDSEGKQILNASGEPVTETASPPEIPTPLLGLVTAIGTALAVHAGKQLGIPTEEEGNEAGAESSMLSKFLNSTIWKRLVEILTSLWKGFHPDNVPKMATVIYLIGLVIAFIFFLMEKGSTASAEFLLTSWTSLLGFLAGAWAIKTD